MIRLKHMEYADLHDISNDIILLCALMQEDLARATVVKASARRARVKTLKLEKLFKDFRKMSVEYHK